MIPLGFEIGTGRRVSVPLAHLAVTGQTQASGKTTTLEALISRSGLRAVAFVTKRGEASFRSAEEMPAFFSEPSDTDETPLWEWVKSILEAVQQQKMGFKEAWIIRASEGARTLADVHRNIKEALKKSKSGFSADMYKCLDAYFNRVLPTINRLPRTKKLNLADGLNVMDLTDYPEPVQSLVIRSVVEWVYAHERGTIVVIPEAWKFIPRDRGGPVKLAAAHLIREGAALRNFVWIDSQDLAMVHTEILKSIGVWILGVQWERNEVKRMLDYIPVNPKIKPHQIMQLGRGEFYVCHGRETPTLTYVQPFWVPDVHAQAIAKGIEPVESAEKIWKEQVRNKPANHPTPSPRSDAPGPALTPQGQDSAAAEPGSLEASGGSPGAVLADPAAAENPEITDAEIAEEAEREEIEDALYKEKCEELEKEVARLRAELAAQPFVRVDRGGSTAIVHHAGKDQPTAPSQAAGVSLGAIQDREELYAWIKQRAAADPGILELLASKPEIRVKIERVTIPMDSSSLEGRIALLIHDGFFDGKGVASAHVEKELARRGGNFAGISIYKALQEVTAKGFLLRETIGKRQYAYVAVPEMKKSIVRG
jgi:hypothetical protein